MNDEKGERYFFKVEKVHAEWKLTGVQFPAWLALHEVSITETIQKQQEKGFVEPSTKYSLE